ncbi:FhaA domain-containing protein [Parafrankia sp. FMc2]|uniref:FhaA domain-containing protein n=1 Tax=Parafrankia sp. FMc2 TaxID=3233196 RepID=UPI0034D668CA
MGVLQRFERRLGGLVEGAFAKVFKGGVEPVEIASALARETDDRRANSSNRVLVPNEFAVELAGGDFARLAPYSRELCDELAEMVREHAAEQRYTFVGPVTVRLAEAADLDIGVFRIRSSVASADAAVVGGRRARPRSAAPGTPHLLITTRAPGGSGGAEREYPLDAEIIVIGRSVECDIRLNDTGVSRRHGEIRRLPDGQFLYVDAGSTNGSLVNGRAATQVKLMNGDRIELGTAVVEFRREDARAGATGPRGPRTPPPAARSSVPPGRPADQRTPPPFDPHQPTSPGRRPVTPAPGRGDRGNDYREGPSPRFRDEPGPPDGWGPGRREENFRGGPAPRYRDDPGPGPGLRPGPGAGPGPGPGPGEYREGPSARFRDDGPPARDRRPAGPPPPLRGPGRGERERPSPGREPHRDPRRDGGRGFRGEPARADDGLEALEPLDEPDPYGSGRAGGRHGDDNRRRDW